MKRTLIVSVLLSLTLLFVSSCDPDGELSYIIFKGVQYPVTGASYETEEYVDAYQWYVQIGTGDCVLDPDDNSWSGTDPLVTVYLIIEQDYYDYDFEFNDTGVPGTLPALYLKYYEGEVQRNMGVKSDPQNLFTVTETGGLFVVDMHVLVSDPPSGEVSEWLTGHFVGAMSEFEPPPPVAD